MNDKLNKFIESLRIEFGVSEIDIDKPFSEQIEDFHVIDRITIALMYEHVYGLDVPQCIFLKFTKAKSVAELLAIPLEVPIEEQAPFICEEEQPSCEQVDFAKLLEKEEAITKAEETLTEVETAIEKAGGVKNLSEEQKQELSDKVEAIEIPEPGIPMKTETEIVIEPQDQIIPDASAPMFDTMEEPEKESSEEVMETTKED